MSSRKALLLTAGVTIAVALCFFVVLAPLTDAPQPLPRFSSYFMQPMFIDDAFGAIGSVSVRSDVNMVLVNHHLLGSNLIAHIMATVATSEPLTVILVSPDHFATGAAPITSVIAQWPTPFGDIEPSAEVVLMLASSGAVYLQEEPFAREHGITNITMFVKKAMPNARLVPIIVRNDAASARIDALAQAISLIPKRTLVIGSFDFTHDATDSVARVNDAHSLQLLESGESDGADDIVVDSKPGIRLLMTLAKLKHLTFRVADQSNSAQLLHDYSRTDVTSYITGTWESR